MAKKSEVPNQEEVEALIAEYERRLDELNKDFLDEALRNGSVIFGPIKHFTFD